MRSSRGKHALGTVVAWHALFVRLNPPKVVPMNAEELAADIAAQEAAEAALDQRERDRDHAADVAADERADQLERER